MYLAGADEIILSNGRAGFSADGTVCTYVKNLQGDVQYYMVIF